MSSGKKDGQLLGRENYNSYLREKFPKYLKQIFDKVLSSAEEGGEVTKIDVTEDENLVSYYVDNKQTCCFHYEIHYKINGEEKPPFEVQVPKLLTSVFIIRGGIRVPVNYMTNDNDIRSFSPTFSFDYDRKLDFETDVFRYKDREDDFEWKEVPLDELDKLPANLLALNEKQSTKLAIKLGEPTPKKGYTITAPLCRKIKEKFNGVWDQGDDFILDKRITSPHLSLREHIRQNLHGLEGIIPLTRRKMFRYGKLYGKDIQRKIDKFFSMQSDSLLSVQNPASSNMINFSTVSSKLVIDKEKVFFNDTFSDLIDVIRTPESVGNVNKNNELNVCTVVEEDGNFSIRCYDYQFKPITIPYYKYYDSKVILEDSVDYITEEIKNPFNYKYRGKKYRGTFVDKDCIIDAKPDDKLSISVRGIPMVNHTDSVRSGMGASMSNQAIELLNPELPIVQPGHQDGYDSPLNLKSEVDGVVTDIVDNKVIINKKHVVESNPIQSSNQLNITSIPSVKVGDKIKKGDVLFRPRVMEDGVARLGANVYIGYMGYGNTFEDGVIVSSAVLDKFTHISIVDVTKYVTEDENLKWIKEVGSKVKSKDVLVSVDKNISEERFKNLTKFISPKRFNSSLIVPPGQQDAYISDVQILYGSGMLTNEKSYLEGYKSRIKGEREKLKSEFNNPYVDMRIVTEPDKDLTEFKYRIIVRMLVINRLKVGDKLTSRYGGKGLVSQIIPEENMPTDANGRKLEMIMNPYAISARKIPALLMETYLGNISENLGKFLEGKDTKKKREVIAEISNPYAVKWSDEEVENYVEKYTKQGKFPIITGSFAKDLPNKINKFYDMLGLPTEGIEVTDGYTKRKIKTPIITGSLYLMKLRALPEFSAKVTSDAMSDKYPVLGAKSRKGGQRIGEMEIWSYFANNMDQYLLERRDPSAENDRYNFLSHLLLTGYDFEDDDGNNMASRKFSANLRFFKKNLDSGE
jgi:hypothetical protein